MSNIVKTIQSRSWTFVLYPESCPEDWESKLVGVPFLRSPLHDSDLNPDNTPKKPHWHFLVSFPNQKSLNQMQALCRELNAPSPQIVKDTRAMARYFLHLDNPEKAQYKKEDMLVGGGFDLENALKLSRSEEEAEEREFVSNLLNKINEYNIIEFEDLVFLVMQEYPDQYRYFKLNSFVLANVVKSRRHRYERRLALGDSTEHQHKPHSSPASALSPLSDDADAGHTPAP